MNEQKPDVVERLRHRARTRNTGNFVADSDCGTMGYYSAGSACLDKEAADEIESLREQLATAQAAYLQFTEASDAKLAKAREALEAVEDALPVGIVVTFAGNPIDHTKLNHAVEAARSCLREISK